MDIVTRIGRQRLGPAVILTSLFGFDMILTKTVFSSIISLQFLLNDGYQSFFPQFVDSCVEFLCWHQKNVSPLAYSMLIQCQANQ